MSNKKPTGMPWNEAIRELGEMANKQAAERRDQILAGRAEERDAHHQRILDAGADPELSAAFRTIEAEREIYNLAHESKPAILDPKFDNENVVAGFTLHDNDFGNPLNNFVKQLGDEMVHPELDRLTTEQKEEYFTEIWNRTCSTLHYFCTVRAYHAAKWGDDLYEPRGYGSPESTHAYMTRTFRAAFDDNAKKMFLEYGADGNGEFVFIDKHGTVGYA